MAASLRQFSAEECKFALSDVLEAFRLPENIIRMDEARENAGNDMLKSMQVVFPLAAQIEMEAIEKYGFPRDGDDATKIEVFIPSYAPSVCGGIELYTLNPNVSESHFHSNYTGIIRFTQAVRLYEKQNQDIAHMNVQLRAILIPTLPGPPPPAGDEVTEQSMSVS